LKRREIATDGVFSALRRVYSAVAASCGRRTMPLSGSEEGTMRTLALAAAIVGCLAMSGCAGTNDLARGESRMDNDLDASKVLTVNEWAVHRHATVMWVNYPKRSAHPKETDG
jgi:hypothetical protein